MKTMNNNNNNNNNYTDTAIVIGMHCKIQTFGEISVSTNDH